MTLERKKMKMEGVTTMINEGRNQRKPSQKSPARGGQRGNGLQVTGRGPGPAPWGTGTRSPGWLLKLCLLCR